MKVSVAASLFKNWFESHFFSTFWKPITKKNVLDFMTKKSPEPFFIIFFLGAMNNLHSFYTWWSTKMSVNRYVNKLVGDFIHLHRYYRHLSLCQTSTAFELKWDLALAAQCQGRGMVSEVTSDHWTFKNMLLKNSSIAWKMEKKYFPKSTKFRQRSKWMMIRKFMGDVFCGVFL